MKIYNWKAFNKQGSEINWFRDSFLNIVFTTPASNFGQARGFAITDPSGYIEDSQLINKGWGYDQINTEAYVEYMFNSEKYYLDSSTMTISFTDVSIFNPFPNNSTAIEDIDISLNTQFTYPSMTYSGALFLDPISEGLVSTEFLILLQESSTGYITPYDEKGGSLVVRMEGIDHQISLFTVNPNTDEISWTDEIEFGMESYRENVPLTINIGFRAEDEGVFERRLKMYHKINGINYLFSEIIVNAQSDGEDERYDTHIKNMGLPDPKEIPKLFKETDIKEALPDWKLLNQKSKNIILDQQEIKPYIGTYKALSNAIKWLGYDDITIKEWFLNVKDSKKLSLYVPFDANERKKTILTFSAEERKNLKKLNSLSLIYYITRETDEIDEWGNPIIEECYDYNIDEVLIKLFNLKTWLEKNIIGVNARITDITGESVILEKYENFIYGTINHSTKGEYIQSLTPYTLNENDRSELLEGNANINLSLKELQKLKIQDFPYRFIDLINYVWDPSNGAVSVSNSINIEDYDASVIRVGPTFRYPFYDLNEIQWISSTSKDYSGILTNEYVTNPLHIYNNTICFNNQMDNSSYFYESSTNLSITLKKAYLRDPSQDVWEDSSIYSIYKSNKDTILESSSGDKIVFGDIFSLRPSNSNVYLKYEESNVYNVPLFFMKNFEFVDPCIGASRTLEPNKEFILDIQDGYISTDSSILNSSNEVQYITNYINFSYNNTTNKQDIDFNVEYSSERIPLFLYDPSIYYHEYYNNGDLSNALVRDNSIYTMDVNHIGQYNIEVNGWDKDNHLFSNKYRNQHEVWLRKPTIYSYFDPSAISGIFTISSSDYISPSSIKNIYDKNDNPIFDRVTPLTDLNLKEDNLGNLYVEIPSFSYRINKPLSGSISKIYNMTEKVTEKYNAKEITVNKDFQDFKIDDSINIVLFNNENYTQVYETTNIITDVSIIDPLTNTDSIILDSSLPSNFVLDASHDMYILNDTYRHVNHNSIQNYEDPCINELLLDVDVSNYTFDDHQLVAFIIEDTSINYSWGSSFRVKEVSGNTHTLYGNIPSLFLDSSLRYNYYIKHAFSSYANYLINVTKSEEDISNGTNVFKIYHDEYTRPLYLDNTFTYTNIDFEHNFVEDNWFNPYDISLNNFYPSQTILDLDSSANVILSSQFDISNYMINQNNIWYITEGEDEKLIMKVYNNYVPFVYDVSGNYNVMVESYDKYGNLSYKKFKGLIKLK